jgi:hypothetical protein
VLHPVLSRYMVVSGAQNSCKRKILSLDVRLVTDNFGRRNRSHVDIQQRESANVCPISSRDSSHDTGHERGDGLASRYCACM